MKIGLQVNGRNETETTKSKTYEIATKPTEGKAFLVDPMGIDRMLFKKEKKDRWQERTRTLILKAFKEVKNNPEKYGRPFKTMIPEKTWEVKTVQELEDMANEQGNHMADWVEQAMEWAQRISNGESWKAVCNEKDEVYWGRLVIWTNGYKEIVGGFSAPSDPNELIFSSDSKCRLHETVPLIVLCE